MERNPHLTERERQELAELERIFAGAGKQDGNPQKNGQVPEGRDPKN